MVEGLEKLLEEARRGDIRGLVFIKKVAPGDNRAGIVGEYRRNAAAALQATFQLEKLLREDDFTSSA